MSLEELKAENARLKAEVERLTAFTTRTIIPNEELQAQVDRLTKAGDELIHGLAPGGSEYSMNENIERWNAAKEGHNMWGVVAPYVVPPCIDKYTAKEGKQSNG